VLFALARAKTQPSISAWPVEIKGGVLGRARACSKAHLLIRSFEAGITSLEKEPELLTMNDKKKGDGGESRQLKSNGRAVHDIEARSGIGA